MNDNSASNVNIDRMSQDLHVDRCLGTLLGCACGDILGANLEFLSAEEIVEDYGKNLVRDFLDSSRRPLGQYTDDTEMTLALSSSLITCEGVSGAHCAREYTGFFITPPMRGYGPGVEKIFHALRKGADYRKTGTMVFPQGSYANGGVMRIAPLGLVFRYSKQEVLLTIRNAPIEELHKAVVAALMCTHVHPKEAIEGAFLQAYAVTQLCKVEDPQNYDVVALVNKIRDMATNEYIKKKLNIVLDAYHKGLSSQQTADPNVTDPADMEIILAVTDPGPFGRQFQIRASEAIACAMLALLKYGKNPEEAVIRTCNWGGDADTIGCIVGSLMGAFHGTAWIPHRWFDKIEERAWGRTFIIETGKKLAELDVTVCDNDVFDLDHRIIKRELEALSHKIEAIQSDPLDSESFSQVYQAAFVSLLDRTKDKMLTPVAVEAWTRLFKGRWAFLQQWLDFAASEGRIRIVSQDNWKAFLNFVLRSKSYYVLIEDPQEQWSVITDFIKSQSSQ